MKPDLRWCGFRQPVEQENWDVVRPTVGDHRYDTPAELELLNRIWALQSLATNHFAPQQKLISKERRGAKGDQETRHPGHPIPASPERHRNRPQGREDETNPAEYAVEPRSHTTTNSGAHSRTTHPHAQQTGPQNQTVHARTFK